ncbi:MAG: hypothetical protein GY851_36390 [bacterium]|nr:hypothetical protein [bacterium]
MVHRRTIQRDEGFFEQARDWCRGRWWWARVPLLVWFAYLLAKYLVDPAYFSLFGALNLGIHELGHIVWSPLGQFVGTLGGSLTQCLVPAASIFMFYRQRDFFAMAFCLGWLGINLYEVSVYVGDARAMALPLVSPFAGHPIHDWNYLLREMGMLHLDKTIAGVLRVVGAGLMVAFLVAGSVLAWFMATLEE